MRKVRRPIPQTVCVGRLRWSPSLLCKRQHTFASRQVTFAASPLGMKETAVNTRRRFVKTLSVLPLVASLPRKARGQDIPDFSQLKAGYGQRLKKILAAGAMPYIDIESSCRSGQLDIDTVARTMDQLSIGIMALSADIGQKQFDRGVRYDNLSTKLLEKYPDHFIPVGNGGQAPAMTDATDEFFKGQEKAIRDKQIMLLGEYEFRHYPSPRQAKRSDSDRDVNIPINGPIGHRLFGLGVSSGLPFQLHYEIEDQLLEPLEKMLEQYPSAKVIWCHLAQIRFIERGSRYTPTYVDGLLRRFPNLYFDTAFGRANSVYPLSNQRHSRVWADDGGLKGEWRDFIVAHSKRLLSALDLGGDRMERIAEYDDNHRNFLKRLPTESQHQIAYRTAWSLLFGEDFA